MGLAENKIEIKAPLLNESTLKQELPTLPINSQPEGTSEVVEPVIEETPLECSCVRYAESLVNGIPIINAIDYPLNTITPVVGDIIKLQYYNATTTNYIYHIAVIDKITDAGFHIREANFERCKETSRVIDRESEEILGFFNPARQRLIDNLTDIQKQTLWNESGWSMYNTRGAVLRGKAGEWGVAQFMPGTWEWLAEMRQAEGLSLLDKLNFDDQIEMFLYGWEKGVTWYGRPAQ